MSTTDNSTTDNSGLIVDALQRTNPVLAEAIGASSSWRNYIKMKGARISLYRRYDRGDHRAQLTEQMEKMLRLANDDSRLSNFSTNYCKVIIDKMAGRLNVASISVNPEAEDWLNEVLESNHWDALQPRLWRSAVRDGDSYIMIDPRTLNWIVEPAYDGSTGLVVLTDGSSHQIIWACKLWSTVQKVTQDDSPGSVVKVAVYQKESVRFFLGVSGQNSLERELTDEAIPWPAESLPIETFANQADSYFNAGESEIRVVLPLQDILNRMVYSMVMASEFSAFSVIWSLGFEIDPTDMVPGGVINLVLTDSDGNPLQTFDDEAVNFLKAARVGQFAPTDITMYTTQISRLVEEISYVSETPIYGINASGSLSGTALQQLEIGLLHKISRFQKENTDSIKHLVKLTAELQDLFDTERGDAPEIDDVKVIWQTAEMLDINARIATLVTLREKAPNLFTKSFFVKRIGSLLGMTTTDIDDELEAAKQESADYLDAIIGAGGRTNPPI